MPRLDGRQLLASTTLTSPPTLFPVSSTLASALARFTVPPTVQLTTVTVLEIIYLAAPTSPVPSSSTAASSAAHSASSAQASNLAAYATDSYDGLTFAQLGAAFSSALLALVVLICAAAFFLRQAGQMRRLMEQSDEETLSDVSLGGGAHREKGKGRARGRRGERRGLMGSASERTDTTSDSSDSDGDEDVKL